MQRSEHILTSQIEIAPNDLDDPAAACRREIESRFVNRASQIYGHCVRIVSIDDLEQNTISRITGGGIYTVTHRIGWFKPQVGQEITGQVSSVFPDGVFVDVHGIMVLVPLRQHGLVCAMGGCLHEESDTMFFPHNDMTVRITSIRFEKTAYQCIGAIVI